MSTKVNKTIDKYREEVLVMDFHKIKECCRTCMARGYIMSEIFDKDDIVNQIEYSTGLKLEKEDDLPTKMCVMCVRNLKYAITFKRTCTISYETFKSILTKRNVKTELTEDNYDDDDNLKLCMFRTLEVKNETSVPEEKKRDLKKRSRGRPRKSLVVSSANGAGVKKESSPALDLESIDEKESLYSENGDFGGPSHEDILEPITTKSSKKKDRKYTFKKLYCDICNIRFSSKEESIQHKKDHDGSYVCEFCGKMFKHRSTHASHLKSHLPPDYMCDQCDYKTWNKYDLIKHIKFHKGIKSFQCKHCSAAYVTSSNLADHIRRHHQRIKPFKCEICHHAFFDRSKLNRHLDSHNNVKRFVCDICKSGFTRRCYWKKHLLRHHGIQMPRERPGRKRHAVKMEEMATAGERSKIDY